MSLRLGGMLALFAGLFIGKLGSVGDIGGWSWWVIFSPVIANYGIATIQVIVGYSQTQRAMAIADELMEDMEAQNDPK